MKNRIISIIIILCCNYFSQGQEVDIRTIERVAINAYKELKQAKSKEYKINETIPIKSDDFGILYYIININKEGVVIVSAEKSMTPILGRSLNGNFSYEKAPPGLIYLLEKYKIECIDIRKKGKETSKEIDYLWKKYDVPITDYSPEKDKLSTGPLIETKWGQKKGYNRFCPTYNSNGDHCAAGCVAVAMAQVLKYWSCKVNETGSHSYWWTPSWLSPVSTLLEADFENANYQWAQMDSLFPDDHNALLVYHCGIACEMKYGETSSSLPNRAKDGIKNYFGFSDDIEVKWRVYWSSSSWKNLLQNQLMNGWPVIYSGGSTDGGHTWVLDGFDSNGAFYCNWGWYGSQDGSYYLGDFSNDNGNFNLIESAIVNAHPVRTIEVGQPTLQTSYIYAGTSQISVTPVDPANRYEWSTTSGVISGTGTTATLRTSTNTKICVRAFNDQCNVVSNWGCANYRLLPGIIVGSNIICSSNQTYSVQSYPANTTFEWTYSNNLAYISGQGTRSIMLKAINSTTSGYGWIKVNVKSSNYNHGTTTKEVWVGKPSFSIISEDLLQLRERGMALIENSNYDPYSYQGVSQIDWSYTGPLTNFVGWINRATFKAGASAGQGFIYANAYNTCGATEEQFYFQVVDPLRMTISPNPTSNHIDVDVTDEEAIENNINNPEYNITIVNMYGNIVYKEKHKGKSFKINVSKLSKGMHSISLERNNKTCSENFVKE
ncbi:MAG TPA: C10 family peptidase [Tenuifilaceae bacterium]|nr:C10 family peptidase [Tenuifilaceae bacterium]HPE19298.1 C10 family peptidase [Tenuifilaceae bacterium]HPJ46918.1 C10 family peptidase [Tenuifilaceae bacterium]HPQ35314.1 C10 family peptidase [Tenuifilaceae bacterium]HRX69147.1 C10 family peptidase [Tenuifilaceae bacterium]